MNYYPMLFKPIYKQAVWGGTRMRELFGRDLPFERTGESWDVCCRETDMSVVENGALAGERFIDVINGSPEPVLGEKIYTAGYKAFPLLVKLIDATMDLSVQVHPGDSFAADFEGEPFGKNEMWYISEAPPNSSIVIGLSDGVTREALNDSLDNGNAEALFRRLGVRKGDIISIPAGAVHAIPAGVMVYEIQQNTDVTYRLYDYARLGIDGKPRELHIEKALDAIDYSGGQRKTAIPGLKPHGGASGITYYIANKSYAVEKLSVSDGMAVPADRGRFHILTCVSGSCTIRTGTEDIRIGLSRSAFMPAWTGAYVIAGRCELLKSYVPDVGNDFIKPLLESGFSLDDIAAFTDCSI